MIMMIIIGSLSFLRLSQLLLTDNPNIVYSPKDAFEKPFVHETTCWSSTPLADFVTKEDFEGLQKRSDLTFSTCEETCATQWL